ncbi:hypothetical protein N865_01525 [Intrasporangium oryzae NRRL B-24470]|uniref:DUF402 domain-containing protein n=1 Tax=Intrasporangium oryzae NRRL B-24470 TaxID=1386089 RepID=W9GGY5_9MICO|nr:DUF402 domain-containing protein [Intrasporangium oryzae]EWT03129.1 hypothetical protein N865_01525 [Intrasporangium oryzae NRRL B-24470]
MTSKAAPRPGDAVHGRFSKWGGGRHWEWTARYLRADEHGHWFFAPAGTVCSRPGVCFVAEDPWVSLVPRDAGWVAGFYPRSKPISLYVDMATPATWRQLAPAVWEVTMVDLDLDVVLRREGHLFVDDEDEFAVHQVDLDYPPEIIELARRTSDVVYDAIASGVEPFATVGFDVLDAAVAGGPAER